MQGTEQSWSCCFVSGNKIIIIPSLATMETKNDTPHKNMLWHSDNSRVWDELTMLPKQFL